MPAAIAIPLIAAGVGAAGSIGSSLIGSSAAKTAANEQVAEQQQALDFQKQEYGTEQANEAPFVSAGQTAVGQLTQLAPFTAPTLAEAQATPGYRFAQQQGEQGIERGQAAAGGAFTGGTLKSLAGFDTGLADSTYQQIFNNAMSSYASRLNQLGTIASLGQNAAANSGNAGAQAANTVGNTLTNIGATQAAGTIGAANATVSGINGVTGSLLTPLYLQQLNASKVPTPPGWNGSGLNATPPSAGYVTPAEDYIPPAAQYVDAG